MWRFYVAVLPLIWLYIISVSDGSTNETLVDPSQGTDPSAATKTTELAQNGTIYSNRTVAPNEKTFATRVEMPATESATSAATSAATTETTTTALLHTSLQTLESTTSGTKTLLEESNNRTSIYDTTGNNLTTPLCGDTSTPVASDSRNSTHFIDYISTSEATSVQPKEADPTMPDNSAPAPRPPAEIIDQTVTTVPTIESSPQNKTVTFGEEVSLRCRVTRRETTNVTWEHNGVPVAANRHYTVKRNTIKIKGASLEHAGMYQCKASNQHGMAVSQPAYLRVEMRPTIRQGPGNHQVRFGTVLNLTCDVIAFPPPEIAWFEDKEPLREWTNKKFIIINATHSANYTCLYRNQVRGEDKLASKAGEVTIVGPRPDYCAEYNGATCREQIVQRRVFVHGVEASVLERTVANVFTAPSLNSTSRTCRDAIKELICHATFPDCGVLGNKLRGNPICRQDCDMVQSLCGNDWGRLINSNFDRLAVKVRSLDLASCMFLPARSSQRACTWLDFGSAGTITTGEPTRPWRSVGIPSSSRIIPTKRTPGDIGKPETDEINPEKLLTKSYLLLILVIVIPSSIILVIVLIVIAHSVKRHKYLAQFELPKNIDLSGLKDNPMYGKDFNKSFNPHLAYLEYPRNDVVYEKDIGEGAFGRVFKATCSGLVQGETDTSVAVKMLKSTANRDVMEYFNREAQMIARFNSQNIIRLLGVCFVGRPLCLLLEYMAEGDLEDFLHSRSPSRLNSRASSSTGDGLDTHLKLNMASQVANGMVYLNDRRFVHRDIATRNCLVNSNLEVKISDFGLARYLGQKDNFVGHKEEQIPIRWTAPEALWQYQFTFASDMWSFGVLLWEIFSYAEQPYSTLSHEHVFMYTRQGHRLACPESTPKRAYQIMSECWQEDPTKRPSFQQVHDALASMECEWMVNGVGARPQQNSDQPH